MVNQRGRPCKPHNELASRVKVSAPPELIAMARAAGYSNSAIWQFGLMYVTKLLEYGVEIPALKKNDQDKIEAEVEELVAYKLCEHEQYIEEKQIEAEQAETVKESYTEHLIETVCMLKRDYFTGKQTAFIALKDVVHEDPTGLIEYNALTNFLKFEDDGRRLRKAIRKDNEIRTFIEATMCQTPSESLPMEQTIT